MTDRHSPTHRLTPIRDGGAHHRSLQLASFVAAVVVATLITPASAHAEPAPPTTSTPSTNPGSAPPDTLGLDPSKVDQWTALFETRAHASQQSAADAFDEGLRERSDEFTVSWNQALAAADATNLQLPDLDTSLALPAPVLDDTLGLNQPPNQTALEAAFGPAPALPAPGQVGSHTTIDSQALLDNALTGCRLTDPTCRHRVGVEQLGSLRSTALSGSPAMAFFEEVAQTRHDAEIGQMLNRDWIELHDDLIGGVFPDAGVLADQLATAGAESQNPDRLPYCSDEPIERSDNLEESLRECVSSADSVLELARSGGNDEWALEYLAEGIRQNPDLAAQDPRYDLANALSQVLRGTKTPNELERFGDVDPADLYEIHGLFYILTTGSTSAAPDETDVAIAARRWAGDPNLAPSVQQLFSDLATIEEHDIYGSPDP